MHVGAVLDKSGGVVPPRDLPGHPAVRFKFKRAHGAALHRPRAAAALPSGHPGEPAVAFCAVSGAEESSLQARRLLQGEDCPSVPSSVSAFLAILPRECLGLARLSCDRESTVVPYLPYREGRWHHCLSRLSLPMTRALE